MYWDTTSQNYNYQWMQSNHSYCLSKIIPTRKQQIQKKRRHTWNPALWKTWLMHNNRFAKSCVEIIVKLNERWHEIMSLVFLVSSLRSHQWVQRHILFIYVLYPLFHKWLFGMVLWKRSPGGRRGLIGLLPDFFPWSLWFLWTLKFTFIAKIWFILNILIFCQILHNFKVSTCFHLL